MKAGKPQEVLEEAEQDTLLRASAEPDLLRSGRAMIVPAGQLLRRIRAPLLTIATFRGDPAVRLFPWTRTLGPGDALDLSEAAFWPEIEPLVEAGSEALRQVALRWPGYALPPVIGLVTDGSGLAVSGENPSGLTSRWLLDQIEFAAPASIIIPFASNGLWSLLSPGMVPGPAARCH